MNRRIPWILVALIGLMWVAGLNGCSCNDTTTVTGVMISVTSGSGQSTEINTQFAMPLVATVTTNGKPTSGALVTFTAQTQLSGATATFSGGGSIQAVSTGANGQATLPAPLANTDVGSYTVTATVANAASPAFFSLTNTAGAPAELTCTSGSGQSTMVNTAFGAPLVAQVADSMGNPANDSGVVVTFTPPATGASATFAGGMNTATTGANGAATSAVVSANGTPGGPYVVTASATINDTLTTCNFMLTNTGETTENFTFYLSGAETINTGSKGGLPNYYALAGVVTIGLTTGNVYGGEQDYNDGFGITSPQPTGDSITSGQLTVDAITGQGTLTLVTNNESLGGVDTTAGTEEFGVQFVNSNHALIMQFDGSATSSGSLDLQTLTTIVPVVRVHSEGAAGSGISPPSGNFSFTLSGVDPSYLPVEIGGVLSISGTTLTGTFDVNDAESVPPVTTGLSIPEGATVSMPDLFGRGTINDSGIGGLSTIMLNYYIVGPEAIRIIDVDSTGPEFEEFGVYDTGVGSAFGQGSGTFNNASLGTSVFAVTSNLEGSLYGATGQFSTTPSPEVAARVIRPEGIPVGDGEFTGVGDDNELDNGVLETELPISGTYSLTNSGINGYGSLTITSSNDLGGEGLGDINFLGIYMVDPTLNINDPNNTASGLGGALVVDLSSNGDTFGVGVLVPQSDGTTPTFFAGNNYAFGAQDFFNGEGVEGNPFEFDLLGQGSVSAGGVLTEAAGPISDPSLIFDGVDSMFFGVTFTGTAVPDGEGLGRYTMFNPNPFQFTIDDQPPFVFQVVIYQAGGGQLFWLDENEFDVFVGPLEEQSSTPPFPGGVVEAVVTAKRAASTQTKLKH